MSLGENLNDVNERKIEDWTGLCSNEKELIQMNCMIDKKDVFYMSVEKAIFAVSMDTLVSKNATSGAGKILSVGANTCKGSAQFDSGVVTNFRCLCMYDTEESFYKRDADESKDDSVIAIIDNMTRLDYNNIVCQKSGNDLKIQLI